MSAKIASSTTPAMTRKGRLFDFFTGATGVPAIALLAGAGVDVIGTAPFKGTGGIAIFERSLLLKGTGGIAIFERSLLPLAFLALRLVERLAAAFFAGRFAGDFLPRRFAFLTTLFVAFFAGRFAGDFLPRRFAFFATLFVAFFAGRFAEAFFLATTITPSL
ncbi:MAG: hypothetical protein FJW91_05520 [Actinobacteria bacterium]|nr:hypothetical protein [Actinomycetota bacterium]